MRYLIEKYKINGRLLLTIHDEIRYLVKEEDAMRLALALQISNLWTRAYFAYKLGFNDLPLSVGFFSAVDVDHVLRKETDDPCITPTNPDGVPENGRSYSIYDILKVTGPSLLHKDGSIPPKMTQFTSCTHPPHTPSIGLRNPELHKKWIEIQLSKSRYEIMERVALQ